MVIVLVNSEFYSLPVLGQCMIQWPYELCTYEFHQFIMIMKGEVLDKGEIVRIPIRKRDYCKICRNYYHLSVIYYSLHGN